MYVFFFVVSTPAALGFLTVSSAVTMSAPFFLGKVIDTIYTTGTDTETMAASLTSLCIMLTGVFLCGGAANAARVYLMQTSGEMKKHRHKFTHMITSQSIQPTLNTNSLMSALMSRL